MTEKNNNNNENVNEEDRSRGTARGFMWVSLLLVPGLSESAPWDFGVNAELGVIHTDNIVLSPEGMEESDTVYTIAPEFTLQTDGEQTQADIRYRPEAYFYQDFSEEDTVFHVVDASFSTALLRDRLFLDLSGINYQSIVTPEGSLPTSNIPITNNRVDSRVLEARPYWRQRVGNAELLAAVGYRDLAYEGDQFQSSNERYGTFDLNNFGEQAGLAWGVNYNYRRMEYERSVPFEFQRAEVNLGFWAGSALRLFAAGGAETSFDDILEANLDEEFWESGFQYTPDERLNLELAAGERSYGTSFRGEFEYTLRRGALSASYAETPTSRADTFLDRRPLVDDDNLDGILNRPGNTDRFVRKRGELRLDIELNRSDFDLRIFSENREERMTTGGEARPDEKLAGIAARWEWRFGARTSLNLAADLAQRDDSVRDDDIRRYSIGFDYDLTGRTSLRLEGNRSVQESNVSSLFDYTENQGRLLIRVELM